MLMPISVQAQLQLAGVFSENMMLQRDQPVCVFGKALPGQKVNVSLGKEAKSAVTKMDSCWCVRLKETRFCLLRMETIQ
jgi:sialate O-acetylesterase